MVLSHSRRFFHHQTTALSFRIVRVSPPSVISSIHGGVILGLGKSGGRSGPSKPSPLPKHLLNLMPILPNQLILAGTLVNFEIEPQKILQPKILVKADVLEPQIESHPMGCQNASKLE